MRTASLHLALLIAMSMAALTGCPPRNGIQAEPVELPEPTGAEASP